MTETVPEKSPEVARLESLLALHQGCIRETLRVLYAGSGGMRAAAITELERLVPSDVLSVLRPKPRAPCV